MTQHDILDLTIMEQEQRFLKMKKLQAKWEKKKPTEAFSLKQAVTDRLEILSRNYDEFCKVDGKIKMMVKNNSTLNEVYENYIGKNLPGECDLLYTTLRKKLLLMQEVDLSVLEEKQSIVEDVVKENSTDTASETRTRYPRFSGKLTQWPSFKEEYNKSVHLNPTLTDLQKLSILKTVVPASMLKRASFMLDSESSYDDIWKNFENIFQKSDIMESLLIKLLQPSCRETSMEGISNNLEVAESCLRELQAMNVNMENWDSFLIHAMMFKIDKTIQTEWIESRMSDETPPRVSDWFVFVKSKLPADIRSSQSNLNSYENTMIHKCAYCKENHKMTECKKFRSLLVSERCKVVEIRAICTRCLRPNHVLADCYSHYFCKFCQSKDHHFLLHKNALN